jgi:hypothetical protein
MNKELAYLVSNIDLQKKFRTQPDKIKIVLYPELNDTSDILELLPSQLCACFILLKTTANSGHWTVVCRSGTNIYYFDSYGVYPDGELTKIAPDVRYELHENQRSLSRLIRTIPHGFSFSYNSKKFQEYSPTVNTCGKWCECFVKCVFKGLTLDQFQDRLEDLKKKYNESYDQIVCLLWKTL